MRVFGGEELNYTTEHFRRIMHFFYCSLLLFLSLWPFISLSLSLLSFLACCLFLGSLALMLPGASSKLTFLVTFYPLPYQGKCIRMKLARSFDSLSLLLCCQKRENGYLYSPFPQAVVKLWAKFPLKQWLVFLDWLPGNCTGLIQPTNEWEFPRFG